MFLICVGDTPAIGNALLACCLPVRHLQPPARPQDL